MLGDNQRYYGGPMRFGRRVGVGAVSLAVVGLVLAACGSPSAHAAGTQTSGISGKTISIGLSAVESGPDAGINSSTQALEAYLTNVNKSGGVNGYKFKWTVMDNAFAASQSANAAQQLLAKSPFLINAVGSVPVTATVAVAERAHSSVPLLMEGDGAFVEASVKAYPNIFGQNPDYGKLSSYDAQFVMTKLRIKKMGLAWEDDSLASGAAAAIPKYVKSHGGALSPSIPISDSITNFGPIAAQLKASGDKAVLLWAVSGFVAGIQKAAAAIGYNPTWVAPFWNLSNSYLQIAGSVAQGTYMDGYLPPTTSSLPAVKQFDSIVGKAYPDAVNGIAEQGWEFGAIIKAGVQAATAGGKALTRSGFVNALKSMSGQTIALMSVNYKKSRAGAISSSMFQVKGTNFLEVAKSSLMPSP